MTFDRDVRADPFTGRIIFYLTEGSDTREPRKADGWTSRRPIFSTDAIDWKPGEVLAVSDLRGYPAPWPDLAPGDYRVQAVMHANPDAPHGGNAPGNLYSRPLLARLDPAGGAPVRLHIDQLVPPRADPPDLPNLRTVALRSGCLSKFHGRDIYLQAAVVLPADRAASQPAGSQPAPQARRFPALYVIPGFGGNHMDAAHYALSLGSTRTPLVRIGLHGMCGLGHHVYADSDNTGPWGRALVEELIPHLEKEFSLIAEPEARLLTGHSSGGWSSLWLQVTYPDCFGGSWSTSPDSVDFHDFSGLDLYDPRTNFYVDARGELRPIMHRNGKVVLLLKDFVAREDVLGPGGQIGSFEAVFGPRGPDGRPAPLFDRRTGRIDPRIVEAWRRYDIVDRLERGWPTLGPKLRGKLTVIMGGDDNFYLAGAARRLQAALWRLGSDARVFIEPGRDHGTIMQSKPFRRIMEEIDERLRRLEHRGDDG